MRIGLFDWHEQGYALPFSGLQRVVGSPRRFELPRLGPWFDGVLVEQEHLIPCFDLGCWIEGRSVPLPATWYCAIYATEVGEIGIPSTHVVGIRPLEVGTVVPAETGDGLLGAREVFEYRSKVYPILDIDMMVRSMSYA